MVTDIIDLRVRVVVFNATFNNISVISWQSVLLVEKNGVPEKKNTDKLHHLMFYLVHFEMSGFRTNNIRGECHTITTTVTPYGFWTILKNVNLVNDHPWFIHFVFAFK